MKLESVEILGVLVLATLLYPLCVQIVMVVIAPFQSIWFLVFVVMVVWIVFKFVAPYAFSPILSKASFLIVLVPILLIIVSEMSELAESGRLYFSDYPIALTGVMIVNSFVLYLTVKLGLSGRSN